MRRLVFPLLFFFVAGCVTVDRPKPLTGEDVVALAKSGKTPQEIIEELKRTNTVLLLQASDFLKLHAAGVPPEALDHLQIALINDIRWRDRYSQMYWYGPTYRGFATCPWPTLRPFPPGMRPGIWGC